MAELTTYGSLNSRLQGHPDMRKTPGVDMSTGSLGQGLSAGIGMALAARLRGAVYRTYVMLGDGEAQEGQVWEAAMFAGAHRLRQLTAILDYNKFSQTGSSELLLPSDSLPDRWRAFGWDVAEIDGHDLRQILEALSAVADRPRFGAAFLLPTLGALGFQNTTFGDSDFQVVGILVGGAGNALKGSAGLLAGVLLAVLAGILIIGSRTNKGRKYVQPTGKKIA